MGTDTGIVVSENINHLWDNWLAATRELVAAVHPLPEYLTERTAEEKTKIRNLGIELSVVTYALEMVVMEFPEGTPSREAFQRLCRRRKRQIRKEMSEA